MVVVEMGFGFAASAEEPDAWQEGFNNTFIVVPPAATDKWGSVLYIYVATSSCNILYFSVTSHNSCKYILF